MNRLAGKKSKRAEDCNFVSDGKSIETIEGKAEVMCSYYEELYKETTQSNELMPLIEEAKSEIDKWKTNISFTEERYALNPECQEWAVSIEDLELIKKRLNSKKSSGEDKQYNFILNKCPITRVVVNNCFANSYFPVKWKSAVIVPIPKTTTAATQKEYRPISMLSNWDKILEELKMSKMKNEDG